MGLKSKAKFDGQMSDADWNWLKLTCENQNVISKLSNAVNRYITPTMNYNDVQDEFMRSGGTCAEALNYLNEIKRELDYEAETKILQATDEVMNSEEMAQIAKLKAEKALLKNDIKNNKEEEKEEKEIEEKENNQDSKVDEITED